MVVEIPCVTSDCDVLDLIVNQITKLFLCQFMTLIMVYWS